MNCTSSAKYSAAIYLMALPEVEERCITFSPRCDECTVHKRCRSNLQHVVRTSTTATTY